MADFNLGAEVSMDVDPLKASRTTLERNLKAINKSLKDQRKEFKQNELSAEGLAKQENDLGRAIKLQEGLLKKRKDTLSDLDMQLRKSNKVTDEQKIKLQNASRAVQQAENQLNGYQNELKQTQTSQKLLGRSTDEVKNSLGQLKRQAQLTDLTFKQSSKSTSDYQDHLQNLNRTMEKQGAHLKLLKGNLKEVERSQGSNSRAADKLRNDILKESIAFQILQGRIHETRDELGKLQRQQALGTSLAKSWEGMREQMDRIATTLRSIGEIGQGVIQGVLITNLSTLVPILGSVVSLGSGLVGMLTAVAGGAVGMAGAFGIAGGAVQAFAGQGAYALKMLEDGQLKATNEVKNYQSALSGLKTSWESLIKQNQASIFNTMTNGINTAKHALTTLNPFLTTTASQIETASAKMLNWAKTSTNAKKAFDILNTQGPKIFQNILNATQSFVNGSTALFNKLSPLYSWAAKGFENMGKSFDNWANSVQGSKAINGFVEYTKQNLPIVGQIFGNVFKGIISLFQAFSGHSHTVLKGMEGVTQSFKDWANNLQGTEGFKKFLEYLNTNGPKVWEVVKNITQTIWGLLKGMAPVGAVMLNVTKNVTSFTASMTNAHPIIGKVVGVITAVGGAAFLLAKPILLAKGAFAGLSTAISVSNLLLKVSRGQMALSAVMAGKYSTATKIAAVASRGLGLAIRFMTGPIGIVITAIGLFVGVIIHLWKTNATFRKNVIGAWNAIKTGAVAIFGAIKKIAISIWSGLVKGVMFIVRNWKKILFAQFYIMKAVIPAVFKFIKNAAIKIWSSIKSGVVRFARLLYTGVTNYFKLVKKVNSTIFNAVKNFAIKIWNTIKNAVVSRAKSLWNGVRNTFNSLRKGVSNIFNGVKNIANKAWSWIRNKVVNYAKSLWNGVRNTFNSLKKGVSNIFGSVKNNAIKAWNAIKDKLTGIASSIWGSIKKTFNKMKDGLKGIIDKIKSHITGMVDKVKSGLNKLIDGVNWVAGKLGMDKLPKIKLHTGTEHTNTTTNVVKNGKIAKDTFATVGDKGKGNGPGGFRHEMIRYPNGKTAITPNRDTTAYLPQGSTVYNGAQTHAMLSNNPQFSRGTLPRFHSGTLSNKKPKKNKKGDNVFGDAWDATKAGAAKVIEGGKAVVGKTLEAASKGKDWLGDKVGDVLDWIDKPGKLLNKVLEAFGVNMEGFGIPKAASLPFNMMKGMFGKLKKAATDLFKNWFEEQGGGDGGYIDLSRGINFGFARTAAEAAKLGYPFPRAHHGLDINYPYGTKVYSTLNGTATAKSGHNGGFGNSMWIKSGALQAIYGHLSKLAFSGSKKVKPGTYLGKSGGDPSKQGTSAGDSTGPHLHYEMRRNGVAFDPTNWLKKNNGGGSQSKAASKWAPDIKRAAKQMKVNLSNRELKGIIAQIQRESNGNAGVTQGNIGDINNLRGTPAQGLLQYVPSTFKSYAVKGHKNIKNGYDQLLAFFNNSNWRRDLPYGKSGWGPSGSRRFATGTNNAPRGLAQVFEEGGEIMNLRGGETIIPNDVSIQAFKQIASSDIFNRTQSAVYEGISRYADALREKQQQATREQLELQRLSNENTTIQEQNNILKEMFYTMQQQLQALLNIQNSTSRTANNPTNLDGKAITKTVNKHQGKDIISALYNNGGVFN